MGGAAKWIKDLIIGLKKNENNNCAKSKEGSGSSKWKLRRSSSRLGNIVCHERKVAPVDFAAVLEAVVRAPLKDFQLLKKEWAATRIQTAFRGFLARKTLRALKAVVRVQAIFRGQRVRKQAVIAFRSMEAVMRAQIRVRMQREKMTTEGEDMQFVVMSIQNKWEKLKFKAAKPSTSALEVLSEKSHQQLHNINNGSISLERGKSAKPSKKYNTKPDKKLNAAEARCSDPGRLKENNSITNNLTKTCELNLKCKQNHRDLLTSASDFGFSRSPASSSSLISSPILLESEGTEEESKQNHRDLLTSASDFGFSRSTASSSPSSSSISSPILLESEGTEEVSSSNHLNYITLIESIEAKKITARAQRMSRFYRELQHDMD